MRKFGHFVAIIIAVGAAILVADDYRLSGGWLGNPGVFCHSAGVRFHFSEGCELVFRWAIIKLTPAISKRMMPAWFVTSIWSLGNSAVEFLNSYYISAACYGVALAEAT